MKRKNEIVDFEGARFYKVETPNGEVYVHELTGGPDISIMAAAGTGQPCMVTSLNPLVGLPVCRRLAVKFAEYNRR